MIKLYLCYNYLNLVAGCDPVLTKGTLTSLRDLAEQ